VEAARARNRALAVVLITTGVQMSVAMANIVLSTIAPKVAEDLGFEAAWIGYQVSLVFAAATVSTVYGGALVLRWGAARVTEASIVLCATGLALFALPHLAFIAAGSIAIGAGAGLANPTAAHLLVRYTPAARRNLVFSIKQTGVPLGGVVIALAAPALAVTVGWRWALALLIAYNVALLAGVRPFRAEWNSDRQAGEPARARPFAGVAMVWRDESLRWISLVAVLFSVVQRSLLTFTVIYLVLERGYGLLEAGVMLSVCQVGGAIARVFWGWLADRIGSSLVVLALIGAIVAAAMALLVALDSAWPRAAVLALFFVLGMSTVGWNGVFHAECARLSPPGLTSVIAGGTTFFVFGGVLLGPAVFAAAYQAIGSYSATFGLMAGVAVAALGLLALAHRAAGRSRP
jgi:predicted MFS family arabinose efflux permease